MRLWVGEASDTRQSLNRQVIRIRVLSRCWFKGIRRRCRLIRGRHRPPSRLSYPALVQDPMNGLDSGARIALVVLVVTTAGGACSLELPSEADRLASVLGDVFVLHLGTVLNELSRKRLTRATSA